MFNCELISELEVKSLCAKAKEILIEEGNVQNIEPPITVRFFATFLNWSQKMTCHLLSLQIFLMA